MLLSLQSFHPRTAEGFIHAAKSWELTLRTFILAISAVSSEPYRSKALHSALSMRLLHIAVTINSDFSLISISRTVFPVTKEMNFYILFRRNLVFEELKT
jgi:hypothetical protein